MTLHRNRSRLSIRGGGRWHYQELGGHLRGAALDIPMAHQRQRHLEHPALSTGNASRTVSQVRAHPGVIPPKAGIHTLRYARTAVAKVPDLPPIGSRFRGNDEDVESAGREFVRATCSELRNRPDRSVPRSDAAARLRLFVRFVGAFTEDATL